MDALPREVQADVDASPHLALDGFHGPLAQLLDLARTHRVDLEQIPLHDLVEQLTGFLLGTAPLFRKADWLVMAAWLVQLRATLLAPGQGREEPAAAAEAGALRRQLLALRDVQALAAWLDRRPLLGRDVFPRGRPEPLGVALEDWPALDVIAFLWVSLELFDADLPAADTEVRYHPPLLNLHDVADAVSRIRRALGQASNSQALHDLMPAAAETDPPVRRRSAWSSTFMASLELARQGEVALAQPDAFGPIHVKTISAHCSMRACLADGTSLGRVDKLEVAWSAEHLPLQIGIPKLSQRVAVPGARTEVREARI